jgi:hypothetical protein
MRSSALPLRNCFTSHFWFLESDNPTFFVEKSTKSREEITPESARSPLPDHISRSKPLISYVWHPTCNIYFAIAIEPSSSRGGNVSDLKDKSWLELCAAASREQDPEKLLELITALNDVLEQREQQEKAKRTVARPREWPAAPCTVRIVVA